MNKITMAICIIAIIAISNCKYIRNKIGGSDNCKEIILSVDKSISRTFDKTEFIDIFQSPNSVNRLYNINYRNELYLFNVYLIWRPDAEDVRNLFNNRLESKRYIKSQVIKNSQYCYEDVTTSEPDAAYRTVTCYHGNFEYRLYFRSVIGDSRIEGAHEIVTEAQKNLEKAIDDFYKEN